MLPDHLVLFDGVCNLCNASVQRIIRNDNNRIFYFTSLQSETGQRLIKEKRIHSGSIVYLRKGIAYTKSGAVLRIAGKLRFPYPLLTLLLIIPWFIRDWIYSLIATNRYKWFGKKDHCMIPEPDIKDRFID